MRTKTSVKRLPKRVEILILKILFFCFLLGLVIGGTTRPAPHHISASQTDFLYEHSIALIIRKQGCTFLPIALAAIFPMFLILLPFLFLYRGYVSYCIFAYLTEIVASTADFLSIGLCAAIQLFSAYLCTYLLFILVWSNHYNHKKKLFKKTFAVSVILLFAAINCILDYFL